MKIFSGKVISVKMDKTATVAVERIVAHRLYKKRYKRTKKYHVHDELGSKVGQEVRFTASKPYSKLKKWKIVELVEKQASVEGKGKTASQKNKMVKANKRNVNRKERTTN